MKLFGTDGIRGKFNEPPISFDELVKIGYSFVKSLFGNDQGKVLICNDGRESHKVIESALSIGIEQQGSKVIFIGLYPTPALSILLNSSPSTSGLCAGVQITASHNPYYDNGLKFFDNNGYKINDHMQNLIEENYLSYTHEIEKKDYKDKEYNYTDHFNKQYIDYIDDYFRLKMDGVDYPKEKFNILVDCANGATSEIITRIFRDSFIKIIPIHNEPSGKNINENCGATNTSIIKEFISDFNNIEVKSSDDNKNHTIKDLKINLGVAFDGDGDRAIFISPLGVELNGDDILYVLSLFHKKYNSLNSVVGTKMTNHGIQKLYKDNDIKFIETDVGDKNVLKEMIRTNSDFGGESSGHILVPVFNGLYVGDSIITLINLLEVIFKQKRTLDDLKKEIISIPSKLFNIKVQNKNNFLVDADNIKILDKLKKLIGDQGRLLLRPSGTENLIRLLIEHKDANQIEILYKYFYDNINKNTIV